MLTARFGFQQPLQRLQPIQRDVAGFLVDRLHFLYEQLDRIRIGGALQMLTDKSEMRP